MEHTTFFESDTFPGNNRRVKVIRLQTTQGMLINTRHLEKREAGITGVTLGFVPGHGGDVWWVRHDDTDVVMAYGVDELAPIETDDDFDPDVSMYDVDKSVFDAAIANGALDELLADDESEATNG